MTPSFSNWRSWTWTDYLNYFLSQAAAKKRLKRRGLPPYTKLNKTELWKFCEPIRQRIASKYHTDTPACSIILRAFNEEKELLPTLVSYTETTVDDRLAELIVVDNNSSDNTKRLIEAIGANYTFCQQQGIGYATKAGVEASASTAQYVFISDADVRMTSPFRTAHQITKSTSLAKAFAYLENHKQVAAVSTGSTLECSHWSHQLIRRINAIIKKRAIAYWSGQNQFIRKTVLQASGGINEKVEFGHGEDHARQYQLARHCKQHGLELHCGRMVPELVNPVYGSGRRFRNLPLVMLHLVNTVSQSPRELGDDGFPLFNEDQPVSKIHVR